MDTLVRIFFCLALGLGVLSEAMVRPLGNQDIHAAALQSLHACQKAGVVFFAKKLEETDSAGALLYKLAWLQRDLKNNSVTSAGRLFESRTENKLEWRWDGELWADELPLITQSSQCNDGKVTVPSFRELPQELLASLFLSRYDSVVQFSGPARKVLIDYALFRYLSGVKTNIPDVSLLGEFHQTERCEWEALHLLQSAQISTGIYQSLIARCSDQEGLLWERLKLKVADIYLESGEAAKAYALYSPLIRGSKTESIPPALLYRLAVSGILSHASDDTILRNSYKILTNDVGVPEKSSELAPLYRGMLQNLVCNRLASLSSFELSKVLTRTFPTTEFVGRALKLIRNCEGKELSTLLTKLLKQDPKPRQRIEILGLLLSSAVDRGAEREAKIHTSDLAKASKKDPLIAGHVFWKAVGHRQSSCELISNYRKQAKWLPLDDEKWNLWQRKSKNNPEIALDHLKVERHQSQNVLRVPAVLSPPPLDWEADIRDDFGQLFEKHLREVVSLGPK